MAKEANTDELNRCRLILTASPTSTSSENLIAAASAGDVASVILYAAEAEPHVFEAFCKDVTPQLQEVDCAVLIADAWNRDREKGGETPWRSPRTSL